MARPRHPLSELAGTGAEVAVTAKTGSPTLGKVAGHVVNKKLDSGGPI